MNNFEKVKVAIICGPRPSYGFCPLPPLTNSAPEKNIYRLTEIDHDEEIQLTVISACGNSQVDKLKKIKHNGNYINIAFPDLFYKFCLNYIFHNRIFQTLLNHLFKTYDLFSAIYLSKVCNEIRKLNPDLILINSLPQYIRVVRHNFPETKIGLFVRGEMGASRRYLHLMDCIITNSEGISQYVRDLLNDAQIPIYKIPNSLEISFCKKEKNYSKFGKTVIFTGRMQKEKGVYELLQAFKMVQKKLPGTNLILLGGNFNKKHLTNYETLLLQYVSENNMNVNFIGEVPNLKIADYLIQSDVAVFPSIWLESFGMVALEAMRCGLPVIATKRPGFEELVVEGETGYLLDDPEDIEKMAKMIIVLLTEPEKNERLGKNGYKRSLKYLPDRIYLELEKIIIEYFETNYGK